MKISAEKLPAVGKTPLPFSLRYLLKSRLYFWFPPLALSCLVRTDPLTPDGQLTPAGGCHLLSKEVLRPPDKPGAATEPIPLWGEHIPQPKGASWLTTRSPSLLQRLEVAPVIRSPFTNIHWRKWDIFCQKFCSWRQMRKLGHLKRCKTPLANPGK